MAIDYKTRPECPRCESNRVYKNGKDRKGKQQFLCRKCRKRFVEEMKKRATCPYCGASQERAKKSILDGLEHYLPCNRCGSRFARDAKKTGPVCPSCGGAHVVRNGKERSGSQKLRCRDCGRRFVEAPKKRPVDLRRRNIVRIYLIENKELAAAADRLDAKRRRRDAARLRAERSSLRHIARRAEVSRSWLARHIKDGGFDEEGPPESDY